MVPRPASSSLLSLSASSSPASRCGAPSHVRRATATRRAVTSAVVVAPTLAPAPCRRRPDARPSPRPSRRSSTRPPGAMRCGASQWAPARDRRGGGSRERVRPPATRFCAVVEHLNHGAPVRSACASSTTATAPRWWVRCDAAEGPHGAALGASRGYTGKASRRPAPGRSGRSTARKCPRRVHGALTARAASRALVARVEAALLPGRATRQLSGRSS